MSKIFVRRITFELFTANTNLKVVFEPIESPKDELTYIAHIYENNTRIESKMTGGNINKTKALKFLKGY